LGIDWYDRHWVMHAGRDGPFEGPEGVKLSERYFVYTVAGSDAQRQQIKRKGRVEQGDGT
jgi:hypothetical protein